MKIRMFTYWNNCWVRYMEKYFASRPNIDFDVKIASQINSKEVEEADIAVFGWANEHVIELSRKRLKLCRKYVVFCRSYEIFFGHINNIKWRNIDDCLFVNHQFYEEFKGKLPCNTAYIPNAIDIDEWDKQDHGKGFNVAMVANLSHKKGIDLIPQYLSKLVERDSRYVLHVAGDDQEPRHTNYVKHMIKEMGLKKNVRYYGKVRDIKQWLKDKDYLFTCSVTEGHPNNVLEAMCLGIKPIIHNWPGAKANFPESLIWNSIDEAVDMTTNDEYNSSGYNTFIRSNYDIGIVYPQLEEIITHGL